MNRTHTATARFTVASWDESTVVDLDGDTTAADGSACPKRGFSRANVGYAYTGSIDGAGTVAYLIAYRPGLAPVTGFERFEGSIDGHDGSIVLQHDIQPNTARTAGAIYDGLRDRGFSLVTVAQLFGGQAPTSGAWRSGR